MLKSFKTKTLMLLLAILAGGSITSWAQSDNSTVYTSNVALSATGGENASACKVKIGTVEYDGLKAGTSSKSGKVVITVPSGTKYLHLHVAAWKAVTGASLTVAPESAGVEAIALTADDGISNNSPFTFSGDASSEDFYKIITFADELTQDTELSFSCSKRFVIFGVNSEEEGGEQSTTVVITNPVTTGNVGDLLNFPTVTVNDAAGEPIPNATVTWTSSNDQVASIESNGIKLQAAGTATITAAFEGDANNKPSSKSFSLTVIDPNQPGASQENPYTVAQARAAIDAGTGVTGVYAKGIVSKIVTAYNSQYGNISYNISDDGSESADQLQAFRGLDKDGASFTSENDVQVGDEVIVYGNLKKYGSTYEFDAGNQRVWYNRPTVTVEAPVFSLEAGAYAEAQQVEITCATQGATIYYTTGDGTPDTQYTIPITISETTLLKAFAKKGSDVSRTIEAKYVIVDAGDNSADNPFTVADAKEFIDGLEGFESPMDIYASGTISQVDSYSNGSITYWISDDGTTDNQMEVYHGLGLDGAEFTAKTDLNVGDKVVVVGKVVLYNNSVYEFSAGSKLVSLEQEEKVYSVVAEQTQYNIDADAQTVKVNVTYTNCNNSGIYFFKDANKTPFGQDESDVEFYADVLDYSFNDGNCWSVDDAGNITVKLLANTTQEARSVYFQVVATKNDANVQIFTELITITQAAAEDVATITPNPKNINTNYFTQVTNIDELEDGDALLIVGGETYAMGDQQTNNRKGVAVELNDNNDIDQPENVQKLVLVMYEGGYYFYTGEDGYLYAASSSSNYLKTEVTPDANGNAKADISFADDGAAAIVFQGKNTRNELRFNPNNGSPIFSCYGSTSTQSLPRIYKEVVAPAATPSITAANVEIAYDETQGRITYTIKNPVDDGVLTATCDDDWITLGDVTAEVVPFTVTMNEDGAERTATVTLTYTYGSKTATKEVTITQSGSPSVMMTIAEVRAKGEGDVNTKGVVTSVNGKTAYIQDETAAIVVYGSSNLSVVAGDEISVSGTLTDHHGLLEIGTPTYEVLTSDNIIEPEVMTIDNISNDKQGWLIKIEEATVTAISGQNVTIAQGESSVTVRFNKTTDVTFAVNDVITLTGNIGYYDAIQIANPTDIEVQQSQEPSITLDTTNIIVGAEGEVGQIPMTLNNLTHEDIDIEGGCEWVVLEVYDEYIEYTVEPNTGEERTVEFTVTAEGAEPVIFTITQKKFALECSWDLSTNSYESSSEILVKWAGTFADMIAEKASAQTKANNYLGGDNTSSRFYKTSMLTITPAKGYAITSVVFTATTTGYASALANSTWNEAEAVADNTTVTVTSLSGIGEACDLVAQIGGTCGFTKVTVYVEPATCEAITVTDAGYATYVTKNDVEFDEDVAFKAIATKDQVVTFEPITSVPAGTPVLLVGTENQATTIIANIIENANTVTGNLLKASDGTVLGNGSIYALAKKDEVVGFYKVSENAPVYYGKCYLELGDGAREFLAIDNATTTGVQSVATSLQQAGQLFDLQGRQVQQPAKGLYIQNGKKIVVR